MKTKSQRKLMIHAVCHAIEYETMVLKKCKKLNDLLKSERLIARFKRLYEVLKAEGK